MCGAVPQAYEADSSFLIAAMHPEAVPLQGLFDHGVMALTKMKHPVWVIKVSSLCWASYCDGLPAGYIC